MDIKCDRVVAYEMGQKITSHLVNSSVDPYIVFYIRNVTLILHKVTLRLLQLVRE